MTIYRGLIRYTKFLNIFNKMKFLNFFKYNTNRNEHKNRNYNFRNMLKLYKKRKKKFYNKKSKFLNTSNCITIMVIIVSFIYLFYNKFNIFSIYLTIFVYIILMFYLLLFEKYVEKNRLTNAINNIQNEVERERVVFLDKIKEMREIEKNQLKHIILKDSDGYDIKIWDIGRASTLTLGKSTIRNRVDVDMNDSLYSNLISRLHGVLNRVNGIWYYEDLGSQNGSGIERQKDNRKIRVNKYIPVKVQSGDIIHLAKTKILLK